MPAHNSRNIRSTHLYGPLQGLSFSGRVGVQLAPQERKPGSVHPLSGARLSQRPPYKRQDISHALPGCESRRPETIASLPARAADGVAAIHQDALPRDEAGTVTGQPHGHVADILGLRPYVSSGCTRQRADRRQHHRCINRRLIQGDGLQRWEFMQDGRLLRVSVPGKLVLNDAGLIIAAALDGQGLAYSADQLVAEHLTVGRLVRVLADFSPRIEGFCLYYPDRRISVTLRALVRMLKDTRKPAAH